MEMIYDDAGNFVSENVVGNGECCTAGFNDACADTSTQIPGGAGGCINHNDPNNMGSFGGCEDYARNEAWCDTPLDISGWDASHCCICMHRDQFQPVGCGAWNTTACGDNSTNTTVADPAIRVNELLSNGTFLTQERALQWVQCDYEARGGLDNSTLWSCYADICDAMC